MMRTTVMACKGWIIASVLMLGATLCPAGSCAPTPVPPLAPYHLSDKAGGTVAALVAQSDVLVLGETHGTQEVPRMTASLLPELHKMGYRALALEVYADQQPVLAAWASGKSSRIPGFYTGPHDDGRGNIQMLALVRAALSAPYRWKVFCFDVSTSKPDDTWQMRDAGMAQNFSAQWKRLALNAKVIVICGGLHARTANHPTPDGQMADLWPSFAANVQRAYPGKRVHSIEVFPQRGGSFSGGRVNTFTGALLTEAKTRHRPTDDWDLELGLPFATPATFLAPSSPPVVAASPFSGLPIQEIRITGNHRVPTADILRVMQSKQGQPFRPQTLQPDTLTVYDMGEFESVGPFDVQKAPQGGVLLTLTVQENPHPSVPAPTRAAPTP